MSKIVITTNGDHLLPIIGNFDVTHTAESTIMILENSASAALIFGVADSEGDFVAYPDGAFGDGKRIAHGQGAKLMVRVADIAADSVTIERYAG